MAMLNMVKRLGCQIADAVDCMNKMILSLSALLHKLSSNS